jgi:adhesin HecA-like repeat protein
MSTTENVKTTNYLTETILSIHNEVQSALDYISTKATEDGTEFGKSTAILSIQNLRIKIPVKVSLETSQNQLETNQNQSEISVASLSLKQATLLQRRGLVIEQDTTQMKALSSKIVVNLEPNETLKTNQTTAQNTPSAEAPREEWGEIEITFSPIKRQ